MATDRDDFIIAIRSAFIKKSNKQRFSLIALIFFSLILISLSRINFTPINYLKLGLNEIVYRISFIVSLPEQQFNKVSIEINNHFKMYSEYSEMKSKLKKIEGKNFNYEHIILENERLRKLIDEYIINSEELVAKVLLDKNSPFLKSIIVNKGSKNNVKNGMAVLDGPFLIGKVVEVNYATSRVLLISDLNSKIPILVEPGNFRSILSGTGKNFATILYSKDEQQIIKDQVIYTSGSGGIFKAGIPVGKTIDNEKVEFFSKLSQLSFVKLVSFSKENN